MVYRVLNSFLEDTQKKGYTKPLKSFLFVLLKIITLLIAVATMIRKIIVLLQYFKMLKTINLINPFCLCLTDIKKKNSNFEFKILKDTKI